MRCLHSRNSSKALTVFIAFLCTFFQFCHVFFEIGDTVQKVDEMCTFINIWENTDFYNGLFFMYDWGVLTANK